MPGKMSRSAPATFRKRRARVSIILPILQQTYPEARCSLNFETPLQLLVATILSAQCTDERVNLTTPVLFAAYPTAADYAAAEPAELESFVASCGFFRQKAKAIRSMATDVSTKHDGQVPQTMDELTQLAGVGRKTANVVLGNAFNINVGVTVDTHVGRLSRRLGLTRHDDAVKVEADLADCVPQDEWTQWSHLLIWHGRSTCRSQSPKCETCVLLKHCPEGPKVLRQRERNTKPSSKRATSSASR